MTGRIHCLVPGCPRTFTPAPMKTIEGPVDFAEGICSEHWRLVPIDLRRVYARAKRTYAKQPASVAAHDNLRSLWANLKKVAIERSVGL